MDPISRSKHCAAPFYSCNKVCVEARLMDGTVSKCCMLMTKTFKFMDFIFHTDEITEIHKPVIK